MVTTVPLPNWVNDSASKEATTTGVASMGAAPETVGSTAFAFCEEGSRICPRLQAPRSNTQRDAKNVKKIDNFILISLF